MGKYLFLKRRTVFKGHEVHWRTCCSHSHHKTSGPSTEAKLGSSEFLLQLAVTKDGEKIQGCENRAGDGGAVSKNCWGLSRHKCSCVKFTATESCLQSMAGHCPIRGIPMPHSLQKHCCLGGASYPTKTPSPRGLPPASLLLPRVLLTIASAKPQPTICKRKFTAACRPSLLMHVLPLPH